MEDGGREGSRQRDGGGWGSQDWQMVRNRDADLLISSLGFYFGYVLKNCFVSDPSPDCRANGGVFLRRVLCALSARISTRHLNKDL